MPTEIPPAVPPRPESPTPPHVSAPARTLIVGHGYVGSRVAQRSLAAGDRVWATTRRPDGIEPLRRRGVEPIQLDVTDVRTLRNLPTVDRVLIAIAFDRRSRTDRDDVHVRGLIRLLDAIRNPHAGSSTDHLPSICLISTTGVYHQSGGVWVDERSPTRPRREGGKSHLRGEAALRRHWPLANQCVLRLAGIYGPGRIPRIADIAAGRPIPAQGNAYLNLIHVDDAADAVIAAWNRQATGLYCVSDGHPVLRQQYYQHLARCVGVNTVQFITPDGNANDRARSDSNKRIDNRKLRRDLIPRLQHPSCLGSVSPMLRG